jgi:TolB-like protein
LTIAAVAVIGVGYLTVNKFIHSKRPVAGAQTLVSTGQAGAPAQSAVPQNSIAVLPFVDLSEKHDQEYFSDGLAEEVLDLLAKIPNLHVMARTSSFSFKGKPEDVPTIATKLKVANLLEGSVRKSGNRLRVATQLIRANNGERIWSETYDRELKDVFAVQDEIATAVVAALSIQLLPSQHLVSEHRTANIDVYSQYLLGRQFYYRGGPDNTRNAIAALQKAIASDPSYAPAYAALAIAKINLAIYGGASGASIDSEALADAQKAVALAPDLADAYSARGTVYGNHFDWSPALRDLERAIALNPRDGLAQRRYALILLDQGRLAEAIAATKRAIELDPLDGRSWMYLGAALADMREYGPARSAYERAIEMSPEMAYPPLFLAMVETQDGRPQRALEVCRPLRPEAFRLACISDAEYVLGLHADADHALAQLLQGNTQGADYEVARLYARRGETSRAFEWLERAYEQRDFSLKFLKFDDALRSLRSDARYSALLRKMNLSE